MHVLVAEDDPVSRRLLQRHLEGWGHTVAAAENGAAAWSLAESGEFPIVLTDWMMPEVDGLELIRRIRSTPRLSHVYVILLTARAEMEDLVQGMEAGADDFIRKPFHREELRVRLREGERIIRLQGTLTEQNSALRRARDVVEQRVRERTAELAQANEALQREMAERLRAARDLEAAQQQVLLAEREKKQFYRQVIRAVTRDKLCLVDAPEIGADGCVLVELSLESPPAYAELRRHVQATAEAAGLGEQEVGDLVLATGEAATNAIKHARDGRCMLSKTPDRLIVRVSDRGDGIREEDLPESVLKPGFSTKVSLGMGYTLMLELVDRVWLATGPEGTVVQLEKQIQPQDEREAVLLAAFERFGLDSGPNSLGEW